MKRAKFLSLLLAVTSAGWAEISIQDRKQRGTYNTIAQMKVVLRCVDSNGQAVSNER